MDLITLEGRFLKAVDQTFRTLGPAADIGEAQALVFRCPFCFFSADGRVNHEVLCWKDGVPNNVPPVVRWQFSGVDLGNLTLTPVGGVFPRTGECLWRIRVQNGQANVPPELLNPPAATPNVEGVVVTDWQINQDDLAVLRAGGRIRLTTFTFHAPLQPTVLRVIPPPV